VTAPTPGWLSELLDRRVVVLVGSGGVGKTTTAAALGVAAAEAGRRVLVLTIDPARRLADALGLQSVGNQETPISLGESCPGSLHATMLDTAAAFEDLLGRTARDSAMAAAVRENRVYRHLLESLAGAQEYLAGEKIYDAAGRYDLVVLDTPPTANALDFLDASGRIVRLFDDRVFRWLLPADEDGSTGLVRRLLRAPSNAVKRLLARLFGQQFVEDLAEFFLVIAGIHTHVRERSEKVQELFRSEDATFVLVTGPLASVVEEALFFRRQIRHRGYRLAGFVVNRVHPPVDAATLAAGPDQLRGLAAEALEDEVPEDALRALAAALHDNLALMASVARRDQEAVVSLRQRMGRETPVALVPRLADEIHDLRGLRRVGGHLLGEPEAGQA